MKTTFISKIVALIFLFSVSGTIYSQKNETQPRKKNMIHIKMVKNINGVETIVDTTISADFMGEEGVEIPNIDIDFNVDSLMGDINIQMIGIEDQLDDLNKVLMKLDRLKDLEDLKDLEELKELESLKDLEELLDFRFNIKMDSSFIHGDQEFMIEQIGELNFPGMGDTNITIMILDEDDAKYQKFMEELKQDKKEGIKTEKRIMIIEEDCNGKNDKGEKMIIEMQVIIKTCNIEDLNKEDKKRLKNEERSFNEKLKVDHVDFYPNPNNGRFNLGFTLEKQGDTEITIMDINGKSVYSEKLANFTGAYKKEIDISNNAAGIYYIKVSQGKDSFFKKMILQ